MMVFSWPMEVSLTSTILLVLALFLCFQGRRVLTYQLDLEMWGTDLHPLSLSSASGGGFFSLSLSVKSRATSSEE